MRKRIFNVQSFGDIITNSSSEVYCMYDRQGTEQIKDAIKQIVETLRPDINLDDHIEINLAISDDHNFWFDDEYYSGDEYYQKRFNEFAKDKSNEELLAELPEFNESLLEELEYKYNDSPGTLTLNLESKTKLGETLVDSIFKILYAYEYEEIYT